MNLNYTIYYPLTEKYISIYAEKKKGKEDGQDKDGDQDMEEEEQERHGEDGLSASATAEKLAMWRTVEKCMEDGTLDLLREGRLGPNDEKDSGEKDEAESSKSRSKSASEKKAGVKKADVKASKTETRKGKSTKHSAPTPTDEDDESDGGFFEM